MTLQLETPDAQNQPRRSGPPNGYNVALIALAIVVGLVLIALAAFLLSRTSSDGGFELTDEPTTPTSSATLSPTSAAAAGSTTDEPSSATTAGTSSPSTVTTSTPSTATTATSATASTSTTPSTSTQSVSDVVWPDPSETTGFDTPEDAARSFAVDLAGFREPIIGEFRAGDGRSGEIAVQPSPTGPVTLVLVRQLGADDSWWVIAALADDIVLDLPQAGASIAGSLDLVGRARAFEGHVDVAVYRHGLDEPIALSFVTGRGDGVLGPFDERIELDPAPSGPGLLILTAPSAEDGSAWAVTALPLRLT